MPPPIYDELRHELDDDSNAILLPDKCPPEAWSAANYRWSARTAREPAAVVRPCTTEHVARILSWARQHRVPLAVKCGGTDNLPSSSVQGGMVIDMRRLNKVQLGQDKSVIHIGGGCLWSEVYPVCDAAGVSIVGGGAHFVGVGGYFTQAGWSWLIGHHGFACDNILGATVIVPGNAASGGVRTVQCGPHFESSSKTKAEEEYASDLFWAIRGAGANFGIVTEFVVKTHPHVGGHLSGTLHYKGEDLTAIMHAIKESEPNTFLKLRSNNESIYLGFDCDSHGNPEVFVLVWIRAESPEKAKQNPVMSPFWTAIEPTMDNTVFCTTHEQTSHVGDYAEMHSPPRIDGRGWNFPVELFVEDPGFVPTLWAKFVCIAATPGFGRSLFFFECHDLRRAAQPALLATASFPAAGRRPHIGLLAACKYDAAQDDDKADAMVRDVLDYVREAGRVRGIEMLGHPSFLCNGDEKLEDVYMGQVPRLRALKARYDPGCLLRSGLLIPPLEPQPVQN